MSSSSESRKFPEMLIFPLSTVASVLAWLFVHPADLVKVRKQLAPPDQSLLHVVKQVYANGGVLGFFDGLSAGVMRQVTYGTLIGALFDIFRDRISGGHEATLGTRVAAGVLAGGTASFLCCPVEVALVRMQGDGLLPLGQRRGYTHIGTALLRISREDGTLAFWRGAAPSMARSSLVGASQFGFYDECKHLLAKEGGLPADQAQNYAKFLTGFFYSAVTMPMESIKIRMQYQKALSSHGSDRKGQVLKYPSLSRSAQVIFKEEGFRAFYKGYFPYYLRCSLNTVFFFSIFEALKKKANQAYS